VTTWGTRVQQAYVDALGGAATLDETSDPVGLAVPADRWVEAVTLARDRLGCTFFDWLSAVDESAPGDSPGPDGGFRVVCHLVRHQPGSVDHLLIETSVPRHEPVIATVAGVFAGARWHERETHEMFGIEFTEGGDVLRLERLLLADEFEGYPLRKEFVLAARVARPWPGAKEPGESDATPGGSRSRRKARPPGVPDPDEWGPRER
jgi:NADH-quinone oxidoreductase subunit C